MLKSTGALWHFLAEAPLALPVAFAVAGTFDLFSSLSTKSFVFLATGCCLLWLAFVFIDPRKLFLQLLGLASLSVFALSVGEVNVRLRVPSIVEEEMPCEVCGQVVRIVQNQGGSLRLMVQVSRASLGGQEVRDVRCLLSLPYDEPRLTVGQRVSVRGWTRGTIGNLYSDYDFGDYLRTNSLNFAMSADTAFFTSYAEVNIYSLAGYLTEVFMSRLSSAGLSETNVALIRGIVLGDKSGLSPVVRQAFADCGTAHILAVSGLHVGLVYAAFLFVLGLVLPRKVSVVFAVVLAWAYASLTGLAPSSVRACVMLSVVALGSVVGRHVSSLHRLSLALLVLLISDPLSLRCVGTWLSFSAVTGLLAVLPRLQMQSDVLHSSVLQWLLGALSVSLIAQISTTPVTLFVFGRFPVYFLVCNLIVSLCLMPLLVAVVLVGLLPSLPLLPAVVEFSLSSLLSFSVWVGQLPLSVVEVVNMSILHAVLLECCLWFLIAFLAFGNRVFINLSLSMLSVLLVVGIRRQLQLRSQSELYVYTDNGRVNVLSVEKGHAVHYLSEPRRGRSLRAAAYLDRSVGAERSDILPLDSLAIFVAANRRISVWRQEQDTLRKADVVIALRDALPPRSLTDTTVYFVSHRCAYWLLWHRDCKRSNVSFGSAGDNILRLQ